MATTLYIVIPCYNEQEVLAEASRQIKRKLSALKESNTISRESRILFVDDGSKDKTWQIITGLHHEDPGSFSGLKLAANKGHQNALLAGLMAAKDLADAVISMDADLQDDINAIDAFLAKYEEGCDVVYGVRNDRTTDTAFKRATAQGFYKFMHFLGAKVVYNHADYRLMSKRALDALADFKEVNLFLRGMVPLIGYQSSEVGYERGERFAGESKYPLKKMLAFAWDGITSFSIKPIRFVTLSGFCVLAIAILLLLRAGFAALFCGGRGNSVLLLSIWFLGGLQILSLGIVGEYVGKVYSEAKSRPKYLVEAFLDQSVE